MNKKTKYDRRRALNCTLTAKSVNNPGYFKYDVTIGEKDGTVHTQPAYGKDMQDALSRLLHKERLVKVEKKVESSSGLVFLIWCVLMGVPTYFMEKHQSPIYILFGFLAIGMFVGLGMWWYHYVNKK